MDKTVEADYCIVFYRPNVILDLAIKSSLKDAICFPIIDTENIGDLASEISRPCINVIFTFSVADDVIEKLLAVNCQTVRRLVFNDPGPKYDIHCNEFFNVYKVKGINGILLLDAIFTHCIPNFKSVVEEVEESAHNLYFALERRGAINMEKAEYAITRCVDFFDSASYRDNLITEGSYAKIERMRIARDFVDKAIAYHERHLSNVVHVFCGQLLDETIDFIRLEKYQKVFILQTDLFVKKLDIETMEMISTAKYVVINPAVDTEKIEENREIIKTIQKNITDQSTIINSSPDRLEFYKKV